ncbi:hypothetical protein Mal64_38740 [Pseudobythopirellula maris]|uniref:DNA-(apurinic or apyrimidinic site) lyase n=2 Tax=Pseudobythopirellula maris TaxID=2527991 RepID=A0A5C5ZIG4_9BACT|nr:hypothetical protein Mal64_38740 [Pseudobythopirellula maris]
MRIAVPKDFDFVRAVCSYGYFLLAPNLWRPETLSLLRVFDPAEGGLEGERLSTEIDQPGGRGAPVRVRCDRPLAAAERAFVRRALARMLRVEDDLARWRRLNPAAKRRGFGRLFRSPTLFEDMVKTITSCNVGWTSTIRMNELLVELVGEGAFPTAERLARWTPARLQKRCRVGYRAKRIIGLARRFDRGEVDPVWFESPQRSTDELREAILALDGFGPYAAANVLQTLGHYDHLPIDTETYRHYCHMTGRSRPANDKELDPLIEARYARFGPYPFLAYWFELWRDYERRHGDAWTWEPRTTGRSFTASKLK